MSVTNTEGRKIILPRSGPEQFWKLIDRHYAQAGRARWKQLAMLSLRVNSDWPLERIGKAFGHNRGHVQRTLKVIIEDLRAELLATPELLDELRECAGTKEDPA